MLSEKLEAVLSKATQNTRLRDFYDLYILQRQELVIDMQMLRKAIIATCKKRNSQEILIEYGQTLDLIEESPVMEKQWEGYQKKNSYAEGINWHKVMNAVRNLCQNSLC